MDHAKETNEYKRRGMGTHPLTHSPTTGGPPVKVERRGKFVVFAGYLSIVSASRGELSRV